MFERLYGTFEYIHSRWLTAALTHQPLVGLAEKKMVLPAYTWRRALLQSL
ncbi:hypothetical protein [Micromonospora sp. DH14]|nr:hypothetical protein [Micromonospora sp. DH14]MDG9674792.1 hypothetical protein [Micromonospora sp. DH14]